MSALYALSQYVLAFFFTFAIYGLWLRIFIRFFKIPESNTLSRIVNLITNPLVKPLHSLFKGQVSASSPYDWLSLLALVIIEIIKMLFVSYFQLGGLMPLSILLVYVVCDLIIQPCDLLFYLLLIEVILSWVSPDAKHPAAEAIRIINAPLTKLGRMIIPDVSGFDFSPFVAMIILKVISLFINYSLPQHLLMGG